MQVGRVLDELPLGRFHRLHLLTATAAWCALAAAQELSPYIFEGLSELGLGTAESGLFAAAFPAGCVGGALVCAWVGDQYGRRTLLLASTSAAAALGLGLVLAPGFGVLLLLRALEAVAWSVALTITLVWYTEFLPTASRGPLASAFQLGWPVGRALVIGSAGVLGSQQWRAVLLLSAVLLAGLALLIWHTALESPRHLAVSGRPGEAAKVLAAVGALNGSPGLVPDELQPPPPPQAGPSKSGQGGLLAKLTVLRREHGQLFSFALALMSSLACTTVLLDTWGPRIFGMLLFGSKQVPFRVLFLFNIGDLLGIGLSIGLVDRIGRRGCFVIGFWVQAGLLILLLASAGGPLWLSSLIGMLAASTRCFGWEAAQLWIIEVFPTDVRATALAAAIATMRLASVGTLTLSGSLMDTLTPATCLLSISGLQLASGVIAILWLPRETAGIAMVDSTENPDETRSLIVVK